MSDRPLYTNEAALTEANEVALTICNPDADPSPTIAKVRLFNSGLIPTVNTVKADLVAAEVAFTGYPSGGYPVEDFNPAVFAPGGGAVIYSPSIAVNYTSGSAVNVGGYWIEDGAGKVREAYIYDPARTLAVVGNGWPIVVQLGYGRNGA